tara:strand:+ start:11721 stop:12074 length:354 start_codon:yes stop_codon:yes gene_type:complete
MSQNKIKAINIILDYSIFLESINDIHKVFKNCSSSDIQKIKLSVIKQCFYVAVKYNYIDTLNIILGKINSHQLENIPNYIIQQALLLAHYNIDTNEAQLLYNDLPEEMQDITNKLKI